MPPAAEPQQPLSTAVQPRRTALRWLLYCLGICLELLGMAFMAAVIVVFFGHVDSRVLLALTAIGMTLFYSGWFCVRQGSRRPSPSTPALKGGQHDARGARTGAASSAAAPREGAQGPP
jgi:hypothetical protein